MTDIWTWPDGAEKAVIQKLRDQLDWAELTEDGEERRDAIRSLAGDVMRQLAPFITKLLEERYYEAYQRGLDAAEEAVERDYSQLENIARNIDELRQAAWKTDPRNPNRIRTSKE